MIKVIKKTLAVCIVRDAGVNFPISPPCCDYFDVKNISNTITLWLGLGSELRLRIWLVSFFYFSVIVAGGRWRGVQEGRKSGGELSYALWCAFCAVSTSAHFTIDVGLQTFLGFYFCHVFNVFNVF